MTKQATINRRAAILGAIAAVAGTALPKPAQALWLPGSVIGYAEFPAPTKVVQAARFEITINGETSKHGPFDMDDTCDIVSWLNDAAIGARERGVDFRWAMWATCHIVPLTKDGLDWYNAVEPQAFDEVSWKPLAPELESVA